MKQRANNYITCAIVHETTQMINNKDVTLVAKMNVFRIALIGKKTKFSTN